MSAIIRQGHVNRRQARLRAYGRHGVQQRRHLPFIWRFWHHNNGFRQVRHTAEREARVSKRPQIRHGEEVIVLREVDGRFIANHDVVLHRLEGDAVVHRTARHWIHVLEIKAQLVYRPELQRRDGDIGFTIQQPLQYRQTQQQTVRFLIIHQIKRLQELVIQADIHARTVFG